MIPKNKKDLLVSLIIPAYNVSNRIDKLINSLMCQNYKNVEIIIVDNNSTDNTFEILKKYEIKYKNICVLKEEKQGPNYARLKGFLKSKGDYIFFVDADDFIEENALNNFIACINKTDADIVVGDYLELTENYKIIRRMFGAPNKTFNLKKFKETLLYKPTLCNKLIKRELIDTESFIFTSVAEDIIISLPAMARAKNIRYIPVIVYNYVINNNGLSHKINIEKLSTFRLAMAALRYIFIKNDLYNKYKEEIEFIIITHSLYRLFESELLIKREERKIIRADLLGFLNIFDYKNNKYFKKSNIYKLVNFFVRNKFLYNLFLSRIFINLLFNNKIFNKILKKLDK